MIREQIIAGYIKGKDVLDVGSLGQTSRYCLWDVLRENSGTLTGIDLDVPAERLLRDFGISRDHQPQDGRIVKGNMEHYEFGRQFDVVTACDVLEHVTNQGLFLANIHRHLRPAGRLILTTPNAKWPTVFLRPNPTHTLWHDRHTLKRILHETGFEVEEIRTYCGNKPSYSPPARLLCWRQCLLAVSRSVHEPRET